MHYLKRKRERRRTAEYVPRRRGFSLTLISLAMAGAFIVVTKAKNPEMDIRPMVMMFVGVALACVVMNFISGRKKRDE